MSQNQPSSSDEGIQSIHYWRGRVKQVEARNTQLELELEQERRACRHWQKRARELAAALEKLDGPRVAVGVIQMSAAVTSLAGAINVPEGAGE